MTCTEKTLTQKKLLRDWQFNFDRQPRLVAYWKKVDSKLVCQWVVK